ncbi:MAG: hypothetical protein B7Y39_04570 [Bdellovibrio sp. 28-41-41]|nr:MAG: hypothetical protein B7Y39_04570 [Bdellovibrio sp. 28-41-41]
MDATVTEKKVQKSKNADAVVLNANSSEKISKILTQVNSELGYSVRANQKLIVNFLLNKRGGLLSAQELEDLKNENFDLVRALRRATEEAIKAKQVGTEVDLNELVKLIQTPSVNAKSKTPSTRGRKKKDKAPPSEIGISAAPDSQAKAVEQVFLSNNSIDHLGSKSSSISKSSLIKST